MVCGYCSTGCGLNVHLREQNAVGLSPATDYPVNLGMACPKGWEALTVLDASDRATVPLLRDANGQRREVDWHTALRTMVERIRDIQFKYGPDSVAFLSTGQIPTEEMALLGSVAKFGLGIRHGDGNTRQCMATAAVAYKQSFGFDAPPFTYADFEQSDCLVFVGANPCLAHPIMWERVMRNPHRPEIIVIDPRRTETASNATLHLPAFPKSDLTLLYGVAKILIDRGWIDERYIHAHTNGFEEFAEFVNGFPVERVAQETGLAITQIESLAERIHRGQRVSFWWTMGVNQSHQGTRTAQALINLALMTGNIGRPGAGANSITGQCNAMGSRLYSNTSCLLGGRDFASPDDRKAVAEILDIDETTIPTVPGWSYREIVDGVCSGRVKALWVIATNPVHSWIQQNDLSKALDGLEFLVVQDMYHSTETARRADLLFPAAGWGEKEGTFINSERRVGVIRKVRRAPGQALADFHIFRLVAEYAGVGERFRQWSSPEAVFRILQRLSAGRVCDITGIEGYRQIEEAGGIQWPYTEADARLGPPETERRLFADGRYAHADGRARFLFDEPRPLPEPVSEDYPLLLLTGRGSASQWHTQTRTSKSAVLRRLYPRHQYVELHPNDARRCQVRPQQPVWLESVRGRIEAIAVVTATVTEGQVFVPMHNNTTNQLTRAEFDPHSQQPAYKACAVRIRAKR
jgi:assimilatory nitrate reductase catalytic subunit